MTVRIVPVDRAELTPFLMSDRFKHEITYFMSLPNSPGVPELRAGEYWIRGEEAHRWLDDGVFSLVSPLDSANKTEIELSEEQEAWLEWMTANGVEHIRVADGGK